MKTCTISSRTGMGTAHVEWRHSNITARFSLGCIWTPQILIPRSEVTNIRLLYKTANTSVFPRHKMTRSNGPFSRNISSAPVSQRVRETTEQVRESSSIRCGDHVRFVLLGLPVGQLLLFSPFVINGRSCFLVVQCTTASVPRRPPRKPLRCVLLVSS